MNTNSVYSREFLQGAPEKKKQDIIDYIVDKFKDQLYNVATEGKKSYILYKDYIPSSGMSLSSWFNLLTDAELIAGLFTRFPGCNIYYDEQWVETKSDTKTLKKGFVIDWS